MNPILPPRLITVSVLTAYRGPEACFGYGVVPGTRAGHDMPLHVIVFIDKPVFAGKCISSKVIGMIGDHCVVAVDEKAAIRYESLEEVPAMSLMEVEDFLCEKGWHIYRPRLGAEEACDRLAEALCRGIELGRRAVPMYAMLS